VTTDDLHVSVCPPHHAAARRARAVAPVDGRVDRPEADAFVGPDVEPCDRAREAFSREDLNVDAAAIGREQRVQ
jgi:hypothetical protein